MAASQHAKCIPVTLGCVISTHQILEPQPDLRDGMYEQEGLICQLMAVIVRFWNQLPRIKPHTAPGTCFQQAPTDRNAVLNSGNKHQNNPIVSAETVRHSSTLIILYIYRSLIRFIPSSQVPVTCVALNGSYSLSYLHNKSWTHQRFI